MTLEQYEQTKRAISTIGALVELLSGLDTPLRPYFVYQLEHMARDLGEDLNDYDMPEKIERLSE